jgi:serine/threonine protein kinase
MICPKCHTLSTDDDIFCRECGTKVVNSQQMQTEYLPQSLNNFTAPESFKNVTVSADELVLGQVIDARYQIDSKIGTGGMGSVYRATRLQIGDEVAIKILHPQQIDGSQAVERFRREAQASARLKHPNAVTIHDFGVSAEGLQYLVMELVEGSSLRQIIKEQGPLNPSVATEIITQVCAALDEAHRQNIIHRDIKPDNIIINLVANVLRVKVLDFGIARLRDQTASNLTQTGSVMGTPHYMSPEQCIGEELDNRSDIYSLGIVLYEMLCGIVPFNSPTSTAVVVQHVTQTPPPLRVLNVSISAAVESVVLQALEKRREARPQTAGALARDLNSAVQGLVVSSMSSSPQSAANNMSTQHSVSASGTQPTLVLTTPSWGNRAVSPSQVSPIPSGAAHAVKSSNKYVTLLIGALVGIMIAGGIVWLLWGRTDNQAGRSDTVKATNDNITNRSATNSNVITQGSARPGSEPIEDRTVNKIINNIALSESDIAGFSRSDLQRLRNTVFARHGRTFKTPELQRYFDTRAWYTPRFDYSDKELTPTDRFNLKLIMAAEKRPSGF